MCAPVPLRVRSRPRHRGRDVASSTSFITVIHCPGRVGQGPSHRGREPTMPTPSTPLLPNIVLVHGGFVDGSGWQGVYELLAPRAIASPSCRTRPCRWRATSLPPSRYSTSSTGRSSSSATPTAAPSSPRPARDERVAGAGLHRRVRTRQGRVGEHADRRPSARRAGAADPAAARRISCSWTARSSPRPSPQTCPPTGRRSWPTRRCPGASGRSAARSASPPGGRKPSWYLVATDDRMIPPPAQRAMAERAGATVTESRRAATRSTCPDPKPSQS